MKSPDELTNRAKPSALTDVDSQYLAALETRPAYFTVQQCVDLSESVRAMYALQLKREDPCLDGRALDIAVARRFYAADPAALRLIDLAEAKHGSE